MMFGGHAATQAWMDQVAKLATLRDTVAPRGIKTKEIVGSLIEVNMRYPVVSCPERKLGYNFMAAEALWILSGSNRLDFHPEIAKKLRPYSDDKSTLDGAYGPPFIEQLPYVVKTLRKDPMSRQAVVVIFTRSPEPSKDVPCTVSMQFVRREKVLHTNVFMRSSDAWMGLPYDIFSFTMMSMTVALMVGAEDLGRLTIFMGSSHLYERDWDGVKEMIAKWSPTSTSPWTVKAFRHSVNDLMVRLKTIADSDSARTFLIEGFV